MSDDRELRRLARLIKQRNEVERDVASIIERPMQIGHVGEFIASRIFNIELHESAVHRGSDGYFVGGPLDGRSVNIKFNGKNESVPRYEHQVSA